MTVHFDTPIAAHDSTLRSTSAPRPGRVLGREEAFALANRLLDLVSSRSLGVQIEHNARSVTKIANGRVLMGDDGDEITIRFSSDFGSGLPVTVSTNQLDDTTLRKVVAQAQAIAPPLQRPEYQEEDDSDDPKYYTYNKREYLPVTLWHENSVAAMTSARSDTVPRLLEQLAASKLSGAASVGITARSTLMMYKIGLTAWNQETDCEVTLSARAGDGTASGWAGQAHRDWSRIDAGAVAQRAIALAEQGKSPVALEPGRRTVILSATAVAQLASRMAILFDAYMTDVAKSTPFFRLDEAMNKIGEQLFDRRLRISSDPQDLDGGYPPFFGAGTPGGVPGFPVQAQTLVNDGVLVNLSYPQWYARESGKAAADNPHAMRIDAMPGVKTATLEEMIANCQDGVYVNRLTDVSLLDRKTGMVTGVTRDGCFHVKNGKINKPLKNFRFLESPIFAWNRIEMIGPSSRVAFGYTAPTAAEAKSHLEWPPMGRITKWPQAPVIVPPMMIRDFNFSALSEAV